jgi:hypothetical protein
MPDEPEARVARKALKFTGDVAAAREHGFAAHDYTQEQAEVWLTDDGYRARLESGLWDEATKTEAKAIEAEAAPDADAPDPPKRRSSKE